MSHATRIAWSVLLVLVGLGTVAFFGLLLGIADCSPACIERGERAPAYALIGAGVGLATWGILLANGTRRAWARALVVGAAVGVAGALWSVAEGARGTYAWATLALMLGALAMGGWLRGRAR